MSTNGKSIVNQNLPIIRETRRQIKDKLSEIEQIIVNNLGAQKDHRAKLLESIIVHKEHSNQKFKSIIRELEKEIYDLKYKNEQLFKRLESGTKS